MVVRCLFAAAVIFVWQCSAVSNLITHTSEPVSVADGQRSGDTTTWNEDSYSAVVDLDYDSDIVHGEYIVSYDAYYTPVARRELLGTILQSLELADCTIVPKSSLVAFRPSDFDVVRVVSLPSQQVATELMSHPHVRSVTEQRKITRRLSYISEDDVVKSSRILNSWKLSLPNASLPSEQRVGGRKLMRVVAKQITSVLNAGALWNLGYKGQGVKVAIFDTGLPEGHPHFKKVKERTNWTNEKTVHDGLGHGTFVAGVIAGIKDDCLGFAPDAELHIYRVFTNNQVSYTSWFLDAFNYAIMKRVDVLNLSIGGPDFMDQPFVDKVWELTANNVIMVSAIGNDGPLYGTLNNPADQMDVIGVGGINFDDEVAKFSSRGMTTWELPGGSGRLKPDVVTYGTHVHGSSLQGSCRPLSGTSVASPVVAGVVALLASTVTDKAQLNPAVMKQALIEGAQRLPGSANMFEQGHGKVNLVKSYRLLRASKPHASLSPSYIDLTECPYMWPYCSQPMYYTMMPLVVNVTILNGFSVTGRVVGQPTWHPYVLENGGHLLLNFTYSEEFWPWAGYLAVSLAVRPEAAEFDGIVSGHVSLSIQSFPSGSGQRDGLADAATTEIKLPIRAKIIPTPPRQKRILWDQFHNLRYPPGYFPRDNLRMKADPLDWNADHIHTNFRDLYEHLRNAGYFVESLGLPYTCYDAKHYSTLLLVDPEEEFFPKEIRKLEKDITDRGLNLIVFGDWYNRSVMVKIKFYDENTRHWWQPETGGANVPGLNDLLSHFKISLSSRVFEGDFKIGDHNMYYASGTSIVGFPNDGLVLLRSLKDQGEDVITGQSHMIRNIPILGVYDSGKSRNVAAKKAQNALDQSMGRGGRISVYGDSNCLDSSHLLKDCFWLLDSLLDFSNSGKIPGDLRDEMEPIGTKGEAVKGLEEPKRPFGTSYAKFSKVVRGYNSDRSFIYHSVPRCHRQEWVVPKPLNQTAGRTFLTRSVASEIPVESR